VIYYKGGGPIGCLDWPWRLVFWSGREGVCGYGISLNVVVHCAAYCPTHFSLLCSHYALPEFSCGGSLPLKGLILIDYHLSQLTCQFWWGRGHGSFSLKIIVSAAQPHHYFSWFLCFVLW